MPDLALPKPLANLLGGTDDANLLVRLRRKDPEAMGILYDRYGKAAYSLAFRIVGSQEAAESVVAQAALKCWNRVSTFQQTRGGALGVWLLFTTYVTALDSSAEPGPIERGALFQDWPQELDGDRLQSLFWALRGLDEQERKALDSAFLTDLSNAGTDLDRLVASALGKLAAAAE